VHRGEILERVVKQSSLSIKTVITRMNISRTTFYNHINKKDLSLDIIAKYGRIIGYDFSADFPEIKRTEAFINTKEPKTFEEAIAERNTWREKYYDVLEKYNTCMERLDGFNKG
jgi:predicted transcriptional regulator